MPDTKLVSLIALAAAVAAMLIAMSGSITVAASAQRNCENIEKLNTRIRLNAIERHKNEVFEAKEEIKNLDENARLLGITVTPELRARIAEESAEAIAQAVVDRDRTLEQYAPQPCPFLLFPL